jgi:hypothetical protein
MLYQEVQGWATSSPNHNNWPTTKLHHYYFGFFDTPEQETPQILGRHLENCLIKDIVDLRSVGANKTADLVIIPQSQLGSKGNASAREFVNEDDEVDLDAREGYHDQIGRTLFDAYVYGESTIGETAQVTSNQLLKAIKEDDDPERPSFAFWH